jgi:hypothetical protein
MKGPNLTNKLSVQKSLYRFRLLTWAKYCTSKSRTDDWAKLFQQPRGVTFHFEKAVKGYLLGPLLEYQNVGSNMESRFNVWPNS